MRVKNIIELDRISIEEFKNVEKIPLTIVLDNVRSLNNVGAIFRTADAFRVEQICLCGITGVPPNIEIHKTALGAENSVNWVFCKYTKDVVMKFKEENHIICALEQTTGSIPLNVFPVDITRKYVLIVGNEVNGVDQSVVDLSDFAIEIPQLGTKHSLNVSVASSIAVWEFFKSMYQ